MSSSDLEKTENEKYKTFIQSQIKEGSFCNFRREKQFDHLFPKISQDLANGSKSLLDLCCGYGRLIYFLREEFPTLKVTGIDYLPSLIEQAKGEFAKDSGVELLVDNAMEIGTKYPKKFDLTVIYKTVSWLPYYETIVSEAIKVTRKKIYITSLFWDGDLEFILKVHRNPSKGGPENSTYLNTYSLPKFEAFCLKQGARAVHAYPMKLDIDLPPATDPNQLQTTTVLGADSSRLELTGPLVLHWKLIEIVL